MSGAAKRGTLALVGGGEWRHGCRAFDAELLERSGGTDVVVVPTAAAFEHPARTVERATGYFAALGATVKPLMVLNRREAEAPSVGDALARAHFVYLSDGSPMHLRSVLKDSALVAAIVGVYHRGGVLAASGAGATVLCDPMVDPRGGAYTVGIGLVEDLAVFPYHGTAADHLRQRSIELLPRTATLVGIDEETALIRDPDGVWRVDGAGKVSVYGPNGVELIGPGLAVALDR
ncbi:MAG: Type 1 glutamine amidotransferase-like domain-containing protein [Acidimicrobiia bacterium]